MLEEDTSTGPSFRKILHPGGGVDPEPILCRVDSPLPSSQESRHVLSHASSSAVTRQGAFHKFRGVSVVGMCVQLNKCEVSFCRVGRVVMSRVWGLFCVCGTGWRAICQFLIKRVCNVFFLVAILQSDVLQELDDLLFCFLWVVLCIRLQFVYVWFSCWICLCQKMYSLDP